MSRKLATILIGFFLVAVAFGPRLVLANFEPVHSDCHKTPQEMSTTCAVHCLTTAISENEIDLNLTPSFEWFVPATVSEVLMPNLNFWPPTFFERAKVFKDPRVILTTIKRE